MDEIIEIKIKAKKSVLATIVGLIEGYKSMIRIYYPKTSEEVFQIKEQIKDQLQ